MLRGMAFDMDGVIINSHPAHRRAWKEFLRTLGQELSETKLDFILEGRKRQEILRYFLGPLSDDELREYGRKKDEFFQKISYDLEPVTGVIDFLDDVKRLGMPAALATSASERRTRSTLERLGIAEHFCAVVTGDDVVLGKPNPAIYEIAAQKMNLRPEELVAIEDAPRGVEAAVAAGMHCIGVATNGQACELRQSGARHVIKDFVGVSVQSLEEILFKQ